MRLGSRDAVSGNVWVIHMVCPWVCVQEVLDGAAGAPREPLHSAARGARSHSIWWPTEQLDQVLKTVQVIGI